MCIDGVRVVAALSCRDRPVAVGRREFSGVRFGRDFSSLVRPRSRTNFEEREWYGL